MTALRLACAELAALMLPGDPSTSGIGFVVPRPSTHAVYDEEAAAKLREDRRARKATNYAKRNK